MEKRVVFRHPVLPFLLVAPQIAITLIFFMWPASQALYQSVLREDAFGLSSQFVWIDNFRVLFSEPQYLHSVRVTAVFSISVAVSALSVALYLAVQAGRVIRHDQPEFILHGRIDGVEREISCLILKVID